nr:MAG TPA: hypothetical protein [Caudoviricetes sp.]
MLYNSIACKNAGILARNQVSGTKVHKEVQ